jgi:hypothetical protein
VRRFFLIVSAVTAVSLAGCASSGSAKGEGRSPDVITREEIAVSGASTALEAVNRLRPAWLRQRGTSRIVGGVAQDPIIAVYLDGQRLGDLPSLRMLSIAQIQTMQWLDAARASTVLSGLGSDAIAGAIVIKTR